MQRNQRVNKKRVAIDGEPEKSLTKFGELPLVDGTADVAEFDKIVKVKSGTTDHPLVRLTFNEKSGENRYKFYRTWKEDDETHDITLEDTDGHGTTYRTQILTDVEVVGIMGTQEYDAASPAGAQFWVDISFYDIVPLS